MQADPDSAVDFSERRRPPPPPPRKPYLAIAGAVLVLAIIAALAWYLIDRRGASADIEPRLPSVSGFGDVSGQVIGGGATAPAPLETDEAIATVPAPSELDGSDAQVRDAARDMSPALAQWLGPDEQIRKWVLMSAALADGDLVNKNRPLSYPMAPFKVWVRSGQLFASPANYGRADKLVDALVAIPPEQLAAYYRQWSPVLEKSFEELGLEGSLHDRLLVLMDRVREVEPLVNPPRLVRPHVLYLYADEHREQSPDLDKLLWRLGPDNTARLQAYVTQLKGAL